MKSTILLIISLLISIISSTQQSSATVDEPICLRRGQITSGSMLSPIDIEISKSPELLESGECSENAILLKPGVLVDGKMVPSGGYCLANGILLAGMAQSIGGTIEIGSTLPSGKSCSIKAGFGIGVSLSKGVILETLPENTPANQVFAYRDKPLLNNLIYTTQILSDTRCLDGGVIVDGLIIKKNSAIANEDCPPGAARIHVGVVDSKQKGNDTHSSVFTSPNECLVDGVVGYGRVLVSGSLVKLGETLSSGKTCSLHGFDPFIASGVVLRNGIVAIIPDKTVKETKVTEKDDDKADKPELESDIDSKEVKNSIADVVEVAQKEAEKPISKKVKPRKGNCKKRKEKARSKADGLSGTKAEEKNITN